MTNVAKLGKILAGLLILFAGLVIAYKLYIEYPSHAKFIAGVSSVFAALATALWAYTKYVLERGFLPPVRFYVTGKKLGKVDNQYILHIGIHLHNIGSATLIARNIRLDLLYMTTGDQDKKKEKLKLFDDKKRAGRLEFPHSLIKIKGIDPATLLPDKMRNGCFAFKVNERSIEKLKREELDTKIIAKLEKLKSRYYSKENDFVKALKKTIGKKDTYKYKSIILKCAKKEQRGFLVLEHDTFVQAEVDQVYTFVTMVPSDTLCFLTWCSFEYAQNLSWWQDIIAMTAKGFGLIQYTLKHAQQPHTAENVFWISDTAQSAYKSDSWQRRLQSLLRISQKAPFPERNYIDSDPHRISFLKT